MCLCVSACAPKYYTIKIHNADAAVRNSFYVKSHRKLHYTTGWSALEQKLTSTQCSHGIVDDDNHEKCAHVAGVICRSGNPRKNGIINMHKIMYISSHP